MILYFVTWAHGPARIETVAETDAGASFEDVAAMVRSGEIEDVVRVVAFDTARGAGSDVTKAVAEWISDKSHGEFREPYYELIPFIEGFGFKPFKETRRDWLFERADAAYEQRMAA